MTSSSPIHGKQIKHIEEPSGWPSEEIQFTKDVLNMILNGTEVDAKKALFKDAPIHYDEEWFAAGLTLLSTVALFPAAFLFTLPSSILGGIIGFGRASLKDENELANLSEGWKGLRMGFLLPSVFVFVSTLSALAHVLYIDSWEQIADKTRERFWELFGLKDYGKGRKESFAIDMKDVMTRKSSSDASIHFTPPTTPPVSQIKKPDQKTIIKPEQKTIITKPPEFQSYVKNLSKGLNELLMRSHVERIPERKETKMDYSKQSAETLREEERLDELEEQKILRELEMEEGETIPERPVKQGYLESFLTIPKNRDFPPIIKEKPADIVKNVEKFMSTIVVTDPYFTSVVKELPRFISQKPTTPTIPPVEIPKGHVTTVSLIDPSTKSINVQQVFGDLEPQHLLIKIGMGDNTFFIDPSIANLDEVMAALRNSHTPGENINVEYLGIGQNADTGTYQILSGTTSLRQEGPKLIQDKHATHTTYHDVTNMTHIERLGMFEVYKQFCDVNRESLPKEFMKKVLTSPMAPEVVEKTVEQIPDLDTLFGQFQEKIDRLEEQGKRLEKLHAQLEKAEKPVEDQTKLSKIEKKIQKAEGHIKYLEGKKSHASRVKAGRLSQEIRQYKETHLDPLLKLLQRIEAQHQLGAELKKAQKPEDVVKIMETVVSTSIESDPFFTGTLVELEPDIKEMPKGHDTAVTPFNPHTQQMAIKQLFIDPKTHKQLEPVDLKFRVEIGNNIFYIDPLKIDPSRIYQVLKDSLAKSEEKRIKIDYLGAGMNRETGTYQILSGSTTIDQEGHKLLLDKDNSYTTYHDVSEMTLPSRSEVLESYKQFFDKKREDFPVKVVQKVLSSPMEPKALKTTEDQITELQTKQTKLSEEIKEWEKRKMHMLSDYPPSVRKEARDARIEKFDKEHLIPLQQELEQVEQQLVKLGIIPESKTMQNQLEKLEHSKLKKDILRTESTIKKLLKAIDSAPRGKGGRHKKEGLRTRLETEKQILEERMVKFKKLESKIQRRGVQLPQTAVKGESKEVSLIDKAGHVKLQPLLHVTDLKAVELAVKISVDDKPPEMVKLKIDPKTINFDQANRFMNDQFKKLSGHTINVEYLILTEDKEGLFKMLHGTIPTVPNAKALTTIYDISQTPTKDRQAFIEPVQQFYEKHENLIPPDMTMKLFTTPYIPLKQIEPVKIAKKETQEEKALKQFKEIWDKLSLMDSLLNVFEPSSDLKNLLKILQFYKDLVTITSQVDKIMADQKEPSDLINKQYFRLDFGIQNLLKRAQRLQARVESEIEKKKEI